VLRPTENPRRTLVLGLGNPILRDDGVGWRVVQAVEAQMQGEQDAPEFDCVGLGGLSLMERLVDYDRAILVDAIQTKGGAPGAIYWLTLDDLPTLHANAAHDASLAAALELGRSLGAHLPDDVAIVAIEAAAVLDFGEVLTPEVAAAVPRAADMLLALIRETDGS
jgi:hydrogenase maturation protease